MFTGKLEIGKVVATILSWFLFDWEIALMITLLFSELKINLNNK
jgi:hypothetical protein